jgi:hypothetical protein
MRKLIWLVLVMGAMLASGCKITQQTQTTPVASVNNTAPVSESAPSVPEEPNAGATSAPAQPAANVFLDSLNDAIARAQLQAKKGNYDNLLPPDGPLALANLSLSMLEARLPEAKALEALQRAGWLIGEHKAQNAAKLLDDLLVQLEDEKVAEGGDTILADDKVQDIIKLLDSDKPEQALPKIKELTTDLAARPVLGETAAIRADLQDARSAALRKNQPILEAVLGDAATRSAHLARLGN